MRNHRGITLVALIITIIVLLILAIVSINLVINGGILDKTKSAVDKYSEEEKCEQIKMSFLEYEMNSLANKNLDPEGYIKESLEKIYGEGQVTNITLKNKKLKLTIGEKIYQYDISNGKAGEYVYVDPIDYGTKTRATLGYGDDISIGTEKFRVFSISDTEIKLAPYYNIILTTNNPVQSLSAGTIAFSSEQYWTSGNVDIDMNDSRNNIQKYIDAYKKTLENFGVEDIEVRIARHSDLRTSYYNQNPGGGWFFTGTSAADPSSIYAVNNSGRISNQSYTILNGVRPIIIIPIN